MRPQSALARARLASVGRGRWRRVRAQAPPRGSAALRCLEAAGGAGVPLTQGERPRAAPALAVGSVGGGCLCPGACAAKSASARCSFGVMTLSGAARVLLDDAGVHDDHDRADHGAATVDRAQQHGGARIAQIVDQRPADRSAFENASRPRAPRCVRPGPWSFRSATAHRPCSSCRDTACARAGSTAARTFWQTASKSTSGLSVALKGLPCSIDPLLEV